MYIVSDSHTIQDQLFSDNLLRLWRTGAEEELYSSVEDGDIDVSMYKQECIHSWYKVYHIQTLHVAV